MTIRVSGGAITDQMLTGNLRFFKLSSTALDYFAHTTSTGTTRIPGGAAGTDAGLSIISGQDETLYDDTPNTEGTFAAGTGYAAGEIITMSDGSIVTVDAVSTGNVTEFTVTSASTTSVLTGGTITTVSSDLSGNDDFTITHEADNETPFPDAFIVPIGKAVSNSVADRVLNEISSKGTIVIINVIDDNNIHFACDDSGFGWDSPAAGDAAAEMLTAIKALGTIGSGAVDSNDPPVPDGSASGAAAVDLNVGGVTLTETSPFELT